MTREEIVKLFMAISTLFPRDTVFAKKDIQRVDAWHGILTDIPYEAALQAVQKQAAVSPFPPSIAEIRKHSMPQMRTGDEAWAIALNTMRKVGCSVYPLVTVVDGRMVKTFPIEEAKRVTPPDVWAVMERMGYKDMCLSDNLDVVRGQFLRMWDSYSTRQTETAALPSMLRKAILEKARFLLDE